MIKFHIPKGLLLAALFYTATITTSWANSKVIAGKASVIDGDTIEIHDIHIRLHGIDAPEDMQTCIKGGKVYRCGQKAAWALDKILKDKTVECHKKDTDRYGRIVAECFTGPINVNASMIQKGWALAYTKYSDQYISQQSIAQKNKAGMWAGSFESPWDYRHGPIEEERQLNDGCLIKGNISSKGRKIYHLPGTPAYRLTRINESKGERWFCNETEALAAGWSPSHR